MSMLLKNIIAQIYPDNKDRIAQELFTDLPELTPSSNNWYKDFNLFVTYPDTFMVGKQADLNVLIDKLEYLHNFGCTALHILPPFQSPLIDGGFDISDYYSIRKDLGGNDAYDRLIQKAHSLQMHVFLDLVCNHVSQEHSWFQKALSGDVKYRNYFIHSLDKPKFIKKYTDLNGIWARYEIEGEEKDIRVIFSDQAGEIPHWIEGKDGCWYYHTFYPHQIDLEWNNPEVFIEFGNILKFWAKKGLNFRLDAIPFVGKDVKKGWS